MLGSRGGFVFSKRAVLGPAVGADDAGRDHGLAGGRRIGRAVGGRGHPEAAPEAGRERSEALQPDREADLGDAVVGVAQQRRGALQAPGQQVGVRRDPEGATELAAEVGAGEAGGGGEVVDIQRLEVAGVGQISGAEQMTGGGDERLPRSLGVAWAGPPHLLEVDGQAAVHGEADHGMLIPQSDGDLEVTAGPLRCGHSPCRQPAVDSLLRQAGAALKCHRIEARAAVHDRSHSVFRKPSRGAHLKSGRGRWWRRFRVRFSTAPGAG